MFQALSLARERLLVLGDSHANVFRHWRFRWHLPLTRISCCVVGGATASGLANPNSKTQASARFAHMLRTEPATLIATLLGEVDTGFIIWYRAKKYQQSIEAMLDLAVTNYGRLLKTCRQRSPVIVISAPLPTIQDGQDWGEVANLRREVDATLRQRTNLTLEFNRRVGNLAASLDCSFMDLDAESLGPDRTVARDLLNASGRDHHYQRPTYAKLISLKLVAHLRVSARRIDFQSMSTPSFKESSQLENVR